MNRDNVTKEDLEEDLKDYMHTIFQIKSSVSTTKSMNILDILDTMIAPNVESSVAANGVRENIFACKESSDHKDDPTRIQKRSPCTLSCTNPDFKLSGNNCFWVSQLKFDYNEAASQCLAQGAELATINNPEEDNFVRGLMESVRENDHWIGLNDLEVEGNFVWQDTTVPMYTNWNNDSPKNGNTSTNCVMKKGNTGAWADKHCNHIRWFVCSQPAVEECPPPPACEQSCSNSDFQLSGTNCFWASSNKLYFNEAKSECLTLGAQLAKVDNDPDREIAKNMMTGSDDYWIGLNDLEVQGNFVWQDGTTMISDNWLHQPNGRPGRNCVGMNANKQWGTTICNRQKKFFCSMPALSNCDKATANNQLAVSIVQDVMNKRECILPIIGPINKNNDSSATLKPHLPNIDVFLNPAKKGHMDDIVKQKNEIAKSYFNNVDMKSLYPELFS